jgi:hypothetical protein
VPADQVDGHADELGTAGLLGDGQGFRGHRTTVPVTDRFEIIPVGQ